MGKMLSLYSFPFKAKRSLWFYACGEVHFYGCAFWLLPSYIIMMHRSILILGAFVSSFMRGKIGGETQRLRK